MKRLIGLLLMFFSAVGFSADIPKKIISIEGVTEYRLDNGLRVLTVPDPASFSARLPPFFEANTLR